MTINESHAATAAGEPAARHRVRMDPGYLAGDRSGRPAAVPDNLLGERGSRAERPPDRPDRREESFVRHFALHVDAGFGGLALLSPRSTTNRRARSVKC